LESPAGRYRDKVRQRCSTANHRRWPRHSGILTANRAMTARVLVSNRNGTAGSTNGHHRPEHAMKIITADQRIAEKCGAKILIVGPSGVGKTSLLRTLSAEMLASTLFVDIEAGDIAVVDLPVASVRPRRWEECRDLACALGGFNPALPAAA